MKWMMTKQKLKHERWAVADVRVYFTVLCTLFVPQIYETWQTDMNCLTAKSQYWGLLFWFVCFVKMSEIMLILTWVYARLQNMDAL